jgi:hypothetical protein
LRALCGNFKNIFSGKMDQFPLNYITANGLRGIKLACWRALCGKFKKIFIGKMGQFPLNNVTASQEKTVEWLTYISSNIATRYLQVPGIFAIIHTPL